MYSKKNDVIEMIRYIDPNACLEQASTNDLIAFDDFIKIIKKIKNEENEERINKLFNFMKKELPQDFLLKLNLTYV